MRVISKSCVFCDRSSGNNLVNPCTVLSLDCVERELPGYPEATLLSSVCLKIICSIGVDEYRARRVVVIMG